MNDRELQQNVIDELEFDPRRHAAVEAERIRVSIHGGRVCLDGEVDNWTSAWRSSRPRGPRRASARSTTSCASPEA
jgi:hypothetical protein